jgi:uncharacterized protein (DUF1810 family)
MTRDAGGSLQRFIDAQDAPRTGLHAALAELAAGRKTGHWIWYVFPQLRGLGASPISDYYGIAGADEAGAFLQHPVLRDRLERAAALVSDRLAAGDQLADLMDGDLDALKLVSSMTLFGDLARRRAEAGDAALARFSAIAATILEAAAAQGYAPCAFTRAHLGA